MHPSTEYILISLSESKSSSLVSLLFESEFNKLCFERQALEVAAHLHCLVLDD